MKSIGVTLQRTYLKKKQQKEALCDIQLSPLIFLGNSSISMREVIINSIL